MPIPRRFIPSTDSYTTDQPCKVCLADINQRGVPLLRCMYSFKMKLEDESGKSLVAHVSGKDAVTFLCGVHPTNFYKNQIQRYALLEVRYNLTGENDPFSTKTIHPRPMIECCLVSHYNYSYITDQPCEVCLADVTQHGVRLLHCMLLSGMPPTNFRSQLQWLHFPGSDFQSNQ